eukprot:CAMPEP_0174282770 /NCGR_PEP_ID=MMETSP0809-20121228/3314_1 /TAXON_ID=73025 ORGANISM="Eutreptiella gymnastica-like, Strain CCMP1594" /NCGR_SAMPLE_ID=MMETSP0809 /ASSEMBLY_ACC=CAM_ASM_000658 /LENGTH=144 /DNA_ID=CAMNT_0015377193 /DNA_START=788 /DNA_END=1222 /DNA_ORIENTATION=+
MTISKLQALKRGTKPQPVLSPNASYTSRCDSAAAEDLSLLHNQWANIVPSKLIVLRVAPITIREFGRSPAPTHHLFVSILNILHANSVHHFRRVFFDAQVTHRLTFLFLGDCELPHERHCNQRSNDAGDHDWGQLFGEGRHVAR